MWRTLIIAALWLGLAGAAHAEDPSWQECRGVVGPDGPPVLTDCRPLDGVIDPQGRDIWIRSTVRAPADDLPRALYLVGVAASEAWLNGARLGANGRPGPDAARETPGRYQAAIPVRDSLWRPGPNELVVRLSSFHGGARLDYPMGAVTIARYPYPARFAIFAVMLVAAGALLAATFGFGVIHAIRRTGSSLALAGLAGAAALQAVLESLRTLIAYPYPLHIWRLGGIWLLAAAFAILLVNYVATRFWGTARREAVALALVVVSASIFAPGFDQKTGWALTLGVAMAAIVTAVGVRRKRNGARLTLAYLLVFLAVAVAYPEWLVDLSYFVLAACLVLPLLMSEVIRLGRDDSSREAALTRAASRPDRLTVASARGVELVPISQIAAVVGADDYVELRLIGGRVVLHAARLDRLEAALAPGFLRIHRSALVNLAHLRALERDNGRYRACLTEGQPLPVSRSRLAALRDALDDAFATAPAAPNP